MGNQQLEKSIEIVRLRYGQTMLLHEPFEVLLGALLAMKTDAVMERGLACAALPGDDAIGLGLADPFRR